MINLLAVVPNNNNATSLYRAMGPLSLLRRELDLNVVISEKVTPVTIDMMDYVFMQRPATPSGLQLARMAKQHGCPLWVDYDDLLIDIPEDNPAYNAYMNHEVKSSIIGIIQCADVITVSTHELKRQLTKWNKRVYVVPNALHDKHLMYGRDFRPQPLVNWRGSETHQKDLDTYKDQIISLAQEREHLNFNFTGYNPWFITQKMRKSQVRLAPWMDFESYFQHNSQINAPIQMVPLADCTFNRCKSNIAWLEATLAGGVCVAPDWEEWQHPGVSLYGSQDGFKIVIESLLDDPEHCASLWKQSREYIMENLILSQVNGIRERIMDGLYHQSRGDFNQYPEGGE